MRLAIEAGDLRALLGHVRGVIEARNSVPILGNVKLTAETGMLTVTGTDLDAEISARADAEIDAGGSVTAPGHTLHDIVKKLPDGGQVELQTDAGGRLILRCGRSRFTLATLPVGDFPTLAVGELPHRFAIDPAALRTLIDRTRFAICTEPTRYYLTGIYLHARGGMLRAVATDGHRLARADAPLPDGAAGMPGIIVPRKAVAEARKLVDAAADPIEVAVSEKQVRITAGAATLTSKLIDGTFPDYERVIPTDNNEHAEIDRDELVMAVARVSAICADSSLAIKLDVAPGRVDLSATGGETGSAGEELDARYAGDPLTIGFNARYLADILDQLGGDAVRISIGDPQGPALLRQPGDDATLYVLMPMRVA